MGELASTTRQKGATSRVLPVRLYSSHECSATILKKKDVETGYVASQLFFSANLRLNAWIDMVEPGVIFLSSAVPFTRETCLKPRLVSEPPDFLAVVNRKGVGQRFQLNGRVQCT